MTPARSLSRTGACAAGVAAALLAAACGASSPVRSVAGSGGTVRVSATPAVLTEDQRTHAWLTYAACLRQHGAEVQDPSFDQQGNPQWSTSLDSLPRATRQACQADLQGLSTGKGVPTKPSAARLAALTRYAQCLRQHGYPDASDPDPQTGAIRDPAGPNPWKRDPVAEQACEQYAAQARGS